LKRFTVGYSSSGFSIVDFRFLKMATENWKVENQKLQIENAFFVSFRDTLVQGMVSGGCWVKTHGAQAVGLAAIPHCILTTHHLPLTTYASYFCRSAGAGPT
jgi:hypothetical protein